jgi:UDP-N-acetylmuramoyl-L-alanyl-D-glutamate--2,6-diaminopimelate ligase
MKMLLRQIIKSLEVLDIDGSIQREVTGLAYDALRVRPGDIFFALKRGVADGHQQIELAVERGAAAIVCRKNGSIRQGATKIDVAETRVALAQASAEFYRRPGEDLQLIGVTGSSSQWNIAFLLKQLLECSGLPTGLISTVRHEIGARQLPAGRNFPEPCDLQDMLAQMVGQGIGACIIEIPSQALTEDKFVGTPFDVFVFDGPIPNTGSVLRWIEKHNRDKSVCSVINIDNFSDCDAVPCSEMEVRLSFGIDRVADVRASNLKFTPASTRFALDLPGFSFPCEAPLVGRHNIYHLLASVGAALCLDLSPRKICSVFPRLKTPPGSLELISKQPLVYVDEARVPENLEKVLASLEELSPERIILVLGASERSPFQERVALGQVAGRFASHVILTSDNPGREPVEQICSAIARGIDPSRGSSYHFQPDRALAIREAVTMARSGDLVLIAGKGERAHQELACAIIPFDDREHARECAECCSVSSLSGPTPVPTP